MRLPGMVANFGGEVLAGRLQYVAHACQESVVPSRLGKQASRVRVIPLGDRAASYRVAAGMLRRRQPEIAHELTGRAKSVDVTKLAHQANGDGDFEFAYIGPDKTAIDSQLKSSSDTINPLGQPRPDVSLPLIGGPCR